MLKTLTSTVFISNIIISICVGFSYAYIDEDFEIMRTGQNIGLGVTLLVVTFIAALFAVVKAKDLAFRGQSNISKGEIFLIAMFFFTALFTTALIAFIACSLIEGDSNLSDNMLYVFCGVGGTIVLLFLKESWDLFLSIPKKQPAKIWIQFSNFIIPLYSGLAIAVLWEGAFDQSWEADPVDSRKIILSIILAFVLILPFQRLSWYESFIDSHSKKENLMGIGSILISVAIAVTGVL